MKIPEKKHSKIFANYISWTWIKERAKTDPEARALVLLANEIGDEPYPTAGPRKIREWLDELGAPNDYMEILRDLNVCFKNIKIFKKKDENRQSTLQTSRDIINK